ncbi:MAG: AI-2E family transporter [Tissierellia bacterium]|nr:AI-2E family transporter [Tissierellia bacterium]
MNLDVMTAVSPLFNRIMVIGVIALIAVIIYYLIHIGNRYVPEDRVIKINYTLVKKVILTILVVWILMYLFTKVKVLNEFFISFIMALFLAYLINPGVQYLGRKWNVPKWAGVAIVYMGVLLVMVMLAVSVIPRTTAEFTKLVSTLPDLMQRGKKLINIYGEMLTKSLGQQTADNIIESIDENIQMIIAGFQNRTIGTVGNVVSGFSSVFAKIINVIMVPIMTYFLVIDRKRIKNWVSGFVPKKYQKDASILGTEINRVMDDFIRGRIIMAIFVGVSTTIMLFIFKVEFAIVIGIVTMIADIIPYIGPFLGLLPAVIFAFISSPLKALWVLIFFIALQWVENNIVAPKVLSTTLGLHPLVVFITIILAGRLYGVLGMIISVPLVAMSIIVVNFLVRKYKEKNDEESITPIE